MKIDRLVSALFVLTSQIAFAQNDFVVTNKGDTLFGKIVTTSWRGFQTGEVKLKQTSHGETSKRNFTADELRCFSQEKIIYEPQSVEDMDQDYHVKTTKIFVREVIIGAISLYEQKTTQARSAGTYGTVLVFYFKRDKDKVMMRAPGTRNGLIDYFKDCEPVKTAIDSKQLKKNDFKAMVDLYNIKCGNEK